MSEREKKRFWTTDFDPRLDEIKTKRTDKDIIQEFQTTVEKDNVKSG